MRQSSVIKEFIRKKGIQDIIFALEVRFGEVDDAIKNSLASIQDEETLNYLHFGMSKEFRDAREHSGLLP
jgi:hypothetical protein